MIPLLIVTAAIAAITALYVHRDLLCAVRKRRNRDLARAVAEGIRRGFAEGDQFRRDQMLWRAEERIAMSVMRPGDHTIITGVV